MYLRSWLFIPFFVALTLGLSAQASIRGAPWGASVRALQKTFPGGTTSSNASGDIDYFVERNMFERPASLMFSVSDKKGLGRFSVSLHEPANTQRDAEEARQRVVLILTAQFGQPVFVEDHAGIWVDDDGQILLTIVNDLVVLIYTPDDNATKLMRLGYADLRWGDAVSAVQKRYPKGVVSTDANGETAYRIVRTVDGHGNAITDFTFGRKGLMRATILFPKLGTTNDLSSGEYVRAGADEIASTFASIRSQLVLKYGPPTSEDSTQLLWGAGWPVVFLNCRGDGGVALIFRPPGPGEDRGL